jgi:hypothetical protein
MSAAGVDADTAFGDLRPAAGLAGLPEGSSGPWEGLDTL